MDLVDEQHVLRLEVGEHRGEVARALEHRAGGLAQVDAELARDDVRERGLAQARRAEQQHVVERLAARRAPPAMKISSWARTFSWPTYSASVAGPQRALELLSCGEAGRAEIMPVGFDAHRRPKYRLERRRPKYRSEGMPAILPERCKLRRYRPRQAGQNLKSRPTLKTSISLSASVPLATLS